MAKVSKPRVYEVAKDIEVSSREILNLLSKHGIELKNHMSTLEYNEMDIILEHYTQAYEDKNFDLKKFSTKKDEEEKEIKVAKKEDRKEKTKDTKKEESNIQTASLDEPKKARPKRTKRYVDTRPNTIINLDKLDTEKIEELAPVEIKDDIVRKQKFKKNPKTPAKLKQIKKRDDAKKDSKPKVPLEVLIPDEITVGTLAERLSVPATEVIKRLMTLGVMASISQSIDFDVASLVAEDLGATVTKEIILTDEDKLFNDVEDDEASLVPRPPVVVVMGHVDHGKTSLLDAIRKANVIDTEAGGITQHIGAYTVKVNDNKITFLDTPGHEAFTAMRARGAQVTDIAILVVAADDGIMPQTIEAINHAKAANVSIIVAINKIDKETANPDKVKQELTEHGLVPEEWGGDTICVNVSAKQRLNIDSLLEMVILSAEMKELKANPNRRAKGTVVESRLDKGRGPVATVLVQNGTLRVGDIIVAGTSLGRVRAMIDDHGKRIKSALPSTPVEITGLSEVPEGGDIFYVVDDEKAARNVVEARKAKQKAEKQVVNKVSLDDLFAQIKEGQVKDLNIIVKADVQGSVEALKQSLEKLSNEEVRVRVIHGGVGAVTDSDVMLATASNAIIVGFNVRPAAGVMESASLNKVDIRLYRVIYDAIEEIEAAMKGLLEPKFKEVILGHAEIRQVFKITGSGTIAGSYVTDGKIQRNSQVRIVRDGIVVHEGLLNSLKRFKDDVREVASNYECGMGFEKFNDLKVGDIVECFIMEEIEV